MPLAFAAVACTVSVDKKDDLAAGVENYQQLIVQLNAQITSLEQQNASLNEHLEELMTQLDLLVQQLAESGQSHTTQVGLLTTQIGLLTTQVSGLTSTIQVLQFTNQLLEQQIALMSDFDDIAELLGLLSKANSRIDKLEGDVKQLEKRIEQYQDCIRELESIPTVYIITYHLDGGTNSPYNPNAFTVAGGTIVLANPTKQDYAFLGWFPEETSQIWNSVREIVTASVTENLTLYARWVDAVPPELKFTIDYTYNPEENMKPWANDKELVFTNAPDHITLLRPMIAVGSELVIPALLGVDNITPSHLLEYQLFIYRYDGEARSDDYVYWSSGLYGNDPYLNGGIWKHNETFRIPFTDESFNNDSTNPDGLLKAWRGFPIAGKYDIIVRAFDENHNISIQYNHAFEVVVDSASISYHPIIASAQQNKFAQIYSRGDKFEFNTGDLLITGTEDPTVFWFNNPVGENYLRDSRNNENFSITIMTPDGRILAPDDDHDYAIVVNEADDTEHHSFYFREPGTYYITFRVVCPEGLVGTRTYMLSV